ncbi:glycoside hydrolase family 3 domain containing protein [Grosmannia clavigera kw1407]|uniref:beta-glucosidase n=1 Tax=Grosmannia clavigera (strain kw1407 / UAMH 11150) TaxID=655863 RepID=F0XTX7_GROCL|nr:glycoside hydrolase family 3 domain containing protein [Grosmannia clavigera kw1407]EFW98458.1 glycoside hydrolase family 3 domain containing protein [Grosmannia clavigera kw1407]
MASAPDLPAVLPYQDAAFAVDERVEDLLSRMTIHEKAGLLFQDMISIGPEGQLMPDDPVGSKLMNHFNLLGPVTDVREAAEWHNRLQRRAKDTRLSIPVTLSSDPRNHFANNVGTGFNAGALSQWPEPLGLAALRSPELVQQFATIAREEYLALGIRLALHPQVDLATEPRWSRINRTFGEDADLSCELASAYVRGFQGPKLGPKSVATMTKHFPGGGPQKDGEDPHFAYGKEQIYPGKNLDYHLRPFKAAIAAGTTQIMPYYGKPIGTKYEAVGFSFSKGIITDLLRQELGFSGIVCTDWGLVTDAIISGQDMPARAWGVEHLTEIERVQKIIDAGCDQLGGESRPELVVQLVEQGLVSEARIDISVRRLLREKFVLGLFDQPFVDAEVAVQTVGRANFVRQGLNAQKRSFTLLTNSKDILPLRRGNLKVYLEGLSHATATARGLYVVSDPARADIALLRLSTPHEARPGGFEKRFHSGSLAFSFQEQARQAAIYQAVPTIVDVYLDRPAVIPEVVSSAAAVLASYGSSDEALLDVVFGEAAPEGKLPFDLPSSMKAVEESLTDVPYSSESPIFRLAYDRSLPLADLDIALSTPHSAFSHTRSHSLQVGTRCPENGVNDRPAATDDARMAADRSRCSEPRAGAGGRPSDTGRTNKPVVGRRADPGGVRAAAVQLGAAAANGAEQPGVPDGTSLHPGTGALGRGGRGALAEYVRLPASQVTQIDDAVGLEDAAGLHCCGCTALKMIRTASLCAGQTVLVNGASGSVGSVLVQLCKLHGASVEAVASGGNEAMLTSQFIDYHQHNPLPAYLAQNYGDRPFDFLFDCVGSQPLFDHSPAYLQADGALINVSGANASSVNGWLATVRNVPLNTCLPTWMGGVPRRYAIFSTPPAHDDGVYLAHLLEAGSVRIPVDSVFALPDALHAYERVATKHEWLLCREEAKN